MTQIRRFEETDQPAVVRLIVGIMNNEFNASKEAYPMQDIENVTASYGTLGETFLVAEQDRKIVGTVGIKKEDDRVALMRRLFVDGEYRKRKIGIKLIEKAIEFCDKMGYDEIIFKTTSQMQGAIQVCQKVGFVQRAKLGLGPLELLKFSLHLKHNHAKTKES